MKDSTFLGIILYRRDLGEKDRLLDVITEEQGVVTVLAKGAKNPINKLAGSVEKYQLIEFSTSKGKNWEILKEVHIVKQWITKPLDLNTFQLLDSISEIILYLKRFEQVSQEIFYTLQKTLENLHNVYVGTIWFKLHILRSQGLLPVLNTCNSCNKSFSGSKIGFDTTLGQFLCDHCMNVSSSQIIEVEHPTLKLFIALAEANKPVLVKGNITWKAANQMMNIIMKYYLEM